ncbi:Outer membrane lipoprotein LolB [Trichlorobacter thiogenes]|uniref:Outer-membrane lipoprotein LolB n=1 Tax=Trichlorobacter thiogenes TaxID=115783 RepID=A0A1T4PWD0_9BACT|nr:lipoprotein insertase outer membrane protein LolB [Trichlorobacter thiogenes]SJZ95607.1 Outer membrane lipoprotein LolB [Trichlorobacter thiogenes]
MFRFCVLIILSALLSACATKPLFTDNSQVVPGRVVETLSSSVTLSLRTGEKNISGRGFMVYRRPDQMRLILLSPFGTTVMEAQLAGERLTLTYPADGVAYQGQIKDLPPATGQRGFAMLRWVLDSEPPIGAPASGVVEQQASQGGQEQITIKNGLVLEKSLKSGEQVRYRNHTVLAGVRLPLELQMESAEGDRIRLVLEEPEVNTELEEPMFNVPLQGLRLFPLSQLKAR